MPTPTRLEEIACAKVNLYLHVTGRRPDGYHLLDSLAVFPLACDRLTVQAADTLELALEGPFAEVLQPSATGDDNLVLRAARALALAAGREMPGARLILHKHLPVASGIGGGSADAAAALRLLRRFWALHDISDQCLHTIATGLGADVPVCLAQRTARMQGAGEQLAPGPVLPAVGMMLVNCGEAVSTPAVFRARSPGLRPPAALPLEWPDAATLADGLRELSNDLEGAARTLCPAIDAVLQALQALPGCLLARMSGSGATCFALFADPAAARCAEVAARLPQRWWRWSGGLHQPTA
ncbi:4-(cytidine 5'-diphospho)-2-C-methyl-D-erythritol kinase [Lichenicoccus sp.]|uniref:4-(cytidine 5'-diphospho)-2-C-methyl-D-erythritol kinase n=1 Tax=Lichenicoccus sp. TaxID=2781899 RepID=UPI003D0E1046